MQDFRHYNYSFDTVNDFLKAIEECKAHCSEPLIILNGEYYWFTEKFYDEIRKECEKNAETQEY